MTQPLMLLVYERLLPGTQMVTRLEDMDYRVKVIAEAAQLVPQAEQEKPLLVIADLGTNHRPICSAIESLKRNEATFHVPVLAIAMARDAVGQTEARRAGATLVVHDHVILAHLKQFVDQALQLD